MRIWLIGVLFAFSAVALISVSRTAWAEPGTAIFQISCLPGVDFFEVRRLTVSDEPTGLFDGAELDLSDRGYALYAPERHADFSGSEFPVAEGVLENPNYGIHPTRFTCRLRTDAIELVMLPEPSPRFNDILVNDIAVTLRIADRLLIGDVPFNPPESKGPITRLTYDGEIRELRLYGKFGKIWPDQISPRELIGHLERPFRFDGQYLNIWVYETQSFTRLLHPLRAEDIDYHLRLSQDLYDLPVREYRYRGPGAPAQRLIAR